MPATPSTWRVPLSIRQKWNSSPWRQARIVLSVCFRVAAKDGARAHGIHGRSSGRESTVAR
ncbi:MAG TPA: hypothetical protein VGU71_18575 [Candidatus Dormibacteraeota bacterium]|nr:hypothetical protein [Candidatus Dormibacteraeota bacterium]